MKPYDRVPGKLYDVVCLGAPGVPTALPISKPTILEPSPKESQIRRKRGFHGMCHSHQNLRRLATQRLVFRDPSRFWSWHCRNLSHGLCRHGRDVVHHAPAYPIGIGTIIQAALTFLAGELLTRHQPEDIICRDPADAVTG